MAQWLRIRLSTQRTRVQAPFWEDPTCRGPTKAREPQLLRLHSRAREPQLLSPRATQLLKPALLKPAHGNKEWPPLTTTRKSPRAATKTQRSQNSIN